jgi:hypothetical protein
MLPFFISDAFAMSTNNWGAKIIIWQERSK